MKHLLAPLSQGQSLTQEQASEAFDLVMAGQATPSQVGALLSLISHRGPTEAELVGAALAMRRRATPFHAPAGLTLVDTCGTGGSGSRWFNVSTAAGLVAAAAGRPVGLGVAKHGNRAVTSASGSSQVLQELGVNPDADAAVLYRCMEETGFAFFFAPAFHPAMRRVAPIRAELGFRTLFNLMGPLTNPAGVRRQVVGVFDPALTEPIARVLQSLGAEHALVVHGRLDEAEARAGAAPGTAGTPGIGELTTTGPVRVTELAKGRIQTTERFDARSLGLPRAVPADFEVADPAESAARIRSVLSGEKTPARDLVALNAAAALWVGGVASDLKQGLAMAYESIDRGHAARTLELVVKITQPQSK